MRKVTAALLALAVVGGLVLVAFPADAATRYVVTLASSAARADVGQSVTLAGKVSPNAKGQRVKVQRWSGAAWATIARPRLNRHSRYRSTVTVSSPGDNLYRVVKPRSDGHRKGISPVVTVVGWRWRNLSSMPIWNPPGLPSQYFTVLPSGMLGPGTYSPFIKMGTTTPVTARVTYRLDGKCIRFDGHVGVVAGSAASGMVNPFLRYYKVGATTWFMSDEFSVWRDLPDPVHVVRTSDLMSQLGAVELETDLLAYSYVGWGSAKVYCRS
jgi:hypothetical protein